MKKKLILKWLKYKLSFRKEYENKFITVEAEKEKETCSAYGSYWVAEKHRFQKRKNGNGQLINYIRLHFQREKFISKDIIKEYFKL